MINDASIAKTGYGMSKYVAERIIDRASSSVGLNAVVVRVGQLS